MLLHDVARLLHEQAGRTARPPSLSDGEWQALQAIAQHEGVHQNALADIIDIDPVSLGRMLERMEERSLVERRAHTTDRRKRLVFLMPRSRPLIDRIGDEGRVIGDSVMARLSTSDQAFLYEALSLIKSNLLDPDDDDRQHEVSP